MVDKKKEEQMQQVYMQLQMINQQMQEIRAQMEQLQAKTDELEKLKDSLGSLKSINSAAASWSSLGSGMYVPSKVENTKDVLVSVGAGVFVNKDVDSAKELVQSQIEMSEKYTDQMAQTLQMLTEQAEAIQGRAMELAG